MRKEYPAPSGRTFKRVKDPNPPGSGKNIAKGKGVPGDGESEGSWRQDSGLTDRNHIHIEVASEGDYDELAARAEQTGSL